VKKGKKPLIFLFLLEKGFSKTGVKSLWVRWKKFLVFTGLWKPVGEM